MRALVARSIERFKGLKSVWKVRVKGKERNQKRRKTKQNKKLNYKRKMKEEMKRNRFESTRKEPLTWSRSQSWVAELAWNGTAFSADLTAHRCPANWPPCCCPSHRTAAVSSSRPLWPPFLCPNYGRTATAIHLSGKRVCRLGYGVWPHRK